MLHALIMAGGSGTRFWPESRRAHPKQFLAPVGGRSLLQQAVDRCSGLVSRNCTWIVTGSALRETTASQLPGFPPEQILIEPCARNTAPCIGLAALHILRQDPQAILLVLPADQIIQPDADFQASVRQAEQTVVGDPQRLILFGIPPALPATGFGYIERGEPWPAQGEIKNDSALNCFQVKSFREKPDLETAREYLASGRFYWNSGLVVGRASRIRELLARHQPEISTHLERIGQAIGSPDYSQVLEAEFAATASLSFDYAVLELAEGIGLIPAAFDWNDVGSWQSLVKHLGADAEGNIVTGLHVGLNTRNCLIRASEGHLVATLGLEDCLIVQTPTATLVARRSDEDSLRKLVQLLQEQGYERFL